MTLVGAGYRAELRDVFADGVVDVAELILDRYGDFGGYRRPWDLQRVLGAMGLRIFR